MGRKVGAATIANLMAILRLVGVGSFVFSQPPHDHGRAEAKGQSDWHCENTPEFIHNEL